MKVLSLSSQQAVLEPTGTTQDGKPVVAVDGDLYVVHDVIHSRQTPYLATAELGTVDETRRTT